MTDNSSITLGRTQFYCLVAMNAVAIAGILVGVISGMEDRAIIKVRVNEVLGNISETQSQILHFEREAEQRTAKFLPPFETFINQTDDMLNQTHVMSRIAEENRNLTAFLSENFGSDTGYLQRENFQYGQANETHRIAEEIKNILRDINSTLSS